MFFMPIFSFASSISFKHFLNRFISKKTAIPNIATPNEAKSNADKINIKDAAIKPIIAPNPIPPNQRSIKRVVVKGIFPSIDDSVLSPISLREIIPEIGQELQNLIFISSRGGDFFVKKIFLSFSFILIHTY